MKPPFLSHRKAMPAMSKDAPIRRKDAKLSNVGILASWLAKGAKAVTEGNDNAGAARSAGTYSLLAGLVVFDCHSESAVVLVLIA